MLPFGGGRIKASKLQNFIAHFRLRCSYNSLFPPWPGGDIAARTVSKLTFYLLPPICNAAHVASSPKDDIFCACHLFNDSSWFSVDEDAYSQRCSKRIQSVLVFVKSDGFYLEVVFGAPSAITLWRFGRVLESRDAGSSSPRLGGGVTCMLRFNVRNDSR